VLRPGGSIEDPRDPRPAAGLMHAGPAFLVGGMGFFDCRGPGRSAATRWRARGRTSRRFLMSFTSMSADRGPLFCFDWVRPGRCSVQTSRGKNSERTAKESRKNDAPRLPKDAILHLLRITVRQRLPPDQIAPWKDCRQIRAARECRPLRSQRCAAPGCRVAPLNAAPLVSAARTFRDDVPLRDAGSLL